MVFDKYEMHIQDFEDCFKGIFIIFRCPSSQNMIQFETPDFLFPNFRISMFRVSNFANFKFLQISKYAEIDAALADTRTRNIVKHVESNTSLYFLSDHFPTSDLVRRRSRGRPSYGRGDTPSHTLPSHPRRVRWLQSSPHFLKWPYKP